MRILSSFFSKKEYSGLFIPSLDGFHLVQDDFARESFNDVAIHLGYHPDQVHGYFDFEQKHSGVTMVAFEVFSNHIAFVTTKRWVSSLSRKQVNQYLKNFRVETVFDSYTRSDIIQTGIENQSLHVDFLTKVLCLKDSDDNGVFYSAFLGGYVWFENGYLTDFQSANGLNTWAKYLVELNPDLADRYAEYSKQFWGNRFDKVINEFNEQADAFASVPQAMKNPYLELHITPYYTFDFVMLMVCHYNRIMPLSEFLEFNHGRYRELTNGTEDGIREFTLGNFIYRFDREGVLIESFLRTNQ